ncbi:DNA-binding domain-containing protein [Nitrosomonas nitrosa]|uniref:HvfC family RiPP maturation protein n=1 Tax=Nitrosomonas nitrosa TaxID=52442 RepID=UPI0023F8A56E|nr:putative DNA-binding domain-containing protein [Nitrosomonas nitrosa]MCO6433176.1 putative DNA-binding domain-containing protein [Nitrosomonas nitrosa]
MSTPLPEFQRFQYQFTAHIRDPKANARPIGIEARRMKVYSELVYNGIEHSLLICFPVLREVLGKRRWARLVRAFLVKHRCHSPFFRQIPDEFLQFLQATWVATTDYPKFMLELAHYEWMELVLSISTHTPDWHRIDPAGDLLKQRPVLNPVLANLHYNWPVHRIAPHTQVTPKETYLLVFRDVDEQIQFIEINAFTARLLNLLETAEFTGQTALERIAEESRYPSLDVLIMGGLAVMQDLCMRGALLGVLCDKAHP